MNWELLMRFYNWKKQLSKVILIYVAIPVDVTLPVIKNILDLITPNQIVVDAGSTKQALCAFVSDHPNRSRFVATHPMWGTEYSGPEAAVHDAFRGRSCVICEREKSDPEALATGGRNLQDPRYVARVYGC